MTTENKILRSLINDDAQFLKSLETDFTQSNESAVMTFEKGELSLGNISQFPDVVNLNSHLNGVDGNVQNGLESPNSTKSSNAHIPFIIHTSRI